MEEKRKREKERQKGERERRGARNIKKTKKKIMPKNYFKRLEKEIKFAPEGFGTWKKIFCSHALIKQMQ